MRTNGKGLPDLSPLTDRCGWEETQTQVTGEKSGRGLCLGPVFTGTCSQPPVTAETSTSESFHTSRTPTPLSLARVF